MTARGMCVGLICVGAYSCWFSDTFGLYVGNIDRSGCEPDGPGEVSSLRGCFAMELLERPLLLRTRVFASEKAVSVRPGTSFIFRGC